MLKIKAVLPYRNNSIRAKDCIVEKIIDLPGDEFDELSRDLLTERDYIRDNLIHMSYDKDGTRHCLLITGEGRDDGILVYSEGTNYARYAALVPHVQSIIAAQQYPALASLCKKLTDMADYIVSEAQKLSPGENRAWISMDDLEGMSGIDVARNSTIALTLASMLSDRPEIANWEIDKNEFVITPSIPALEQTHEQTPEQTITM